MKKCPRCGQVYTDADLNFCLNDGELLQQFSGGDPGRTTAGNFVDDNPPTLVMDPTRVTNQAWNPGTPPAPWQSQPPRAQNQQFSMTQPGSSRDQTLPIVSLVLGIFSCFMVCCAGGIWLGIPAAIVGYLGMRNADSDPSRYGGRGLAIAGLVIGIVTFLASTMFLLLGAVK